LFTEAENINQRDHPAPAFAWVREPDKLLADSPRESLRALSVLHEQCGEGASTWDGVLLRNGTPMIDISYNGRVWLLIPVTKNKPYSSDTCRIVFCEVRGNNICLGQFHQQLLANTAPKRLAYSKSLAKSNKLTPKQVWDCQTPTERFNNIGKLHPWAYRSAYRDLLDQDKARVRAYAKQVQTAE
jgi:hypothetical protein